MSVLLGLRRMIILPPRSHAILSPSASHRWLECTASARLEEKIVSVTGETTTKYAEEGSRLHELAELKLLYEKGKLKHSDGISKRVYDKRRKAMNIAFTVEQETTVDYYVDTVMENYHAVLKDTPDAELLIEVKLDLTKYIPEGFGSSDAVIVSDTTLIVADLKSGSGVKVDAVNNPQARCYALGATELLGELFDFRKVRTVIIQPRLDNVSEETVSRKELLKWGEKTLKPKAEEAFSGDGMFAAGDHCRFCAARYLCRERAATAMKVFEYGFETPDMISSKEIPGILSALPVAKQWISDIESYAYQQATSGIEVPGYKLVRGRKTRHWKNEEEFVEECIRAGYSADTYSEVKLRSPAQMQKALGKKEYDAVLSELVVETEGVLTLVPESDKRPAADSSELEFNDLLEGD